MDGCQDITSGQYILIVSRPAETTGCFKKVWGKAFSLWQSERTSPGREPRGFHSSRALKDGESVRTVTAAARRTLYLSAAGKEWSNEREGLLPGEEEEKEGEGGVKVKEFTASH